VGGRGRSDYVIANWIYSSNVIKLKMYSKPGKIKCVTQRHGDTKKRKIIALP